MSDQEHYKKVKNTTEGLGTHQALASKHMHTHPHVHVHRVLLYVNTDKQEQELARGLYRLKDEAESPGLAKKPL